MKTIILFMAMLITSIANATPTKVVIGYGAGGTNNIIRSLIADAEALNSTTFLVENKPGANGVIALRSYFSEPASITSLVGVSGGQIILEPVLHPDNNYLNRLKMIGPVVMSPMALAIGKRSKIQTLHDLFDTRIPRQIVNIATAGESHAKLVALIAKHSHHDIQDIRFKGSADGYTALLGGHVDMQVDVYGYFKPYASTVSIAAVAQSKPMDSVPSIHRYIPDATLINIFGIAVNADVTDTKPLEQLLTDGMLKSNRKSALRELGYNVDMNPNADYISREAIPLYLKWVRERQ
jgi:tripartite-type tricarboxylate transporter receptor subunit TctC